jgi:alpha-galactosidase
VEGDMGDAAAKIFARQSSLGYYIAVFNYDDTHTIQVNLNRIDPGFEGSVALSVATGAFAPMSGSDIPVVLAPSESRLRWSRVHIPAQS